MLRESTIKKYAQIGSYSLWILLNNEDNIHIKNNSIKMLFIN
jgi:hypothetical protein